MDNHKEAKNISQSGIVNCQLSIVNCQLTMVDLHGQYLRLKTEIDAAIQNVIDSSAFINGPQVGLFAAHLADYLQVPHVIPCGNGTDALQIALMALDLQPGDEVVLPAFTYIAAAEVVALLGLRPVLVDVDARTFNLDARLLEAAITDKTRAVIVVHLFGQAADMEPILSIASKHHLYVVEDNAQSLGATYTFADGTTQRAGTIGHIGTTSFFPSKPLACYGDGGVLMTRDDLLADRIRMIANHGQTTKYNHQSIGCNSRLDTLQAAVLDVKLRHLDEFTAARQSAAHLYDELLASCAPKLLFAPAHNLFHPCLSPIYRPDKGGPAGRSPSETARTRHPVDGLLSAARTPASRLPDARSLLRDTACRHRLVRIGAFITDSHRNDAGNGTIYSGKPR